MRWLVKPASRGREHYYKYAVTADTVDQHTLKCVDLKKLAFKSVLCRHKGLKSSLPFDSSVTKLVDDEAVTLSGAIEC